jgi:Asp-tRNA(Asn)/Glu-tRNA(Gln) amidotransferase A subunit family amidase
MPTVVKYKSFALVLTFDLWWGIRFDVEGLVTGFGNPDWAKTHELATQTAPAVQILVKAGAKCIGKTHMDEMAFRYKIQSWI